jgi:predicted nucleic acid-binding protein
MSGHEFVDTNIWLYALVDPARQSDSEKHLRAARLVGQLSHPVISSQVVRELCRNLLKKSALTEEHLRRLIDDWYPNCVLHASNQEQHLLASRLRETASFSFWDSLIVAAALDAGCSILYSEDMQHGQVVDGRLTISNPLLG